MKESLGPSALAYPCPVWCVGSYDSTGKPNVMTIAWGGICCSMPPCLSVSLRKATYSYGSIMARRAYTVSVPSAQYAAQADYFGLVSGHRADKFQETGLTPVRSDLVDAPYVGEFPLVIECKVIQVHEIGLHTQFIGEIMDVKADPEVLGEKGHPLMDKVAPFVYGPGIREYWALGSMLAQSFQVGKSLKD
ncbi:MAG: flavin reductase family protein [Desulfovibrionaceae bacterium]